MSLTNSWRGTASINILNNASLTQNVKTTLELDLNKIFVTWVGPPGSSNCPPGASNCFLGSTFPKGLQVAYKIRYELVGWMHTDAGQQSIFNVTPRDSATGKTLQTISVPQSVRWYWQYGPRAESFFTVPQGSLTSGLLFWVSTTEKLWYGAYEMSWTIHYDIIVTRNCAISNIGDPACVDLCLNNLDLCSGTYSRYCLDPNHPERIGTNVCKDYYSKLIEVKGSNNVIDRQVVKYCGTKYHGFDDLDPNSSKSKVPKKQRESDLTICACNLTEDAAADPDANVLYDRYFADLVKLFPAFNIFSIEKKCLYNPCASSEFRPTVIPVGGCKVPQCINNISVTNNGEIDGNVTIKSSINCSQFNTTGLGRDAIMFIIMAIIILVVIIIVFIYLSYSKPRVIGYIEYPRIT